MNAFIASLLAYIRLEIQNDLTVSLRSDITKKTRTRNIGAAAIIEIRVGYVGTWDYPEIPLRNVHHARNASAVP